MAPSERSVASSKGYMHPGVIKLYSTFNDAYSLCECNHPRVCGVWLMRRLRPGLGDERGAAWIHSQGLFRPQALDDEADVQYGSFDIDSARYYAAQLIDTIEFMHEREVIHRDLKPEKWVDSVVVSCFANSSILLDDEMRIKITDFGSAKILGTAQASAGKLDLAKQSWTILTRRGGLEAVFRRFSRLCQPRGAAERAGRVRIGRVGFRLYPLPDLDGQTAFPGCDGLPHFPKDP